MHCSAELAETSAENAPCRRWRLESGRSASWFNGSSLSLLLPKLGHDMMRHRKHATGHCNFRLETRLNPADCCANRRMHLDAIQYRTSSGLLAALVESRIASGEL